MDFVFTGKGETLYVPPGYTCILWDPDLCCHGVYDRARQVSSEQLGMQHH